MKNFKLTKIYHPYKDDEDIWIRMEVLSDEEIELAETAKSVRNWRAMIKDHVFELSGIEIEGQPLSIEDITNKKKKIPGAILADVFVWLVNGSQTLDEVEKKSLG